MCIQAFFTEAPVETFNIGIVCRLPRSGEIKSGTKVLINGASGSVGTFAVQLARHYGGEVTAVCSAANFERVKSLGATDVVDYTTTKILEKTDRFGVIFDAVGPMMETLASDGR